MTALRTFHWPAGFSGTLKFSPEAFFYGLLPPIVFAAGRRPVNALVFHSLRRIVVTLHYSSCKRHVWVLEEWNCCKVAKAVAQPS